MPRDYSHRMMGASSRFSACPSCGARDRVCWARTCIHPWHRLSEGEDPHADDGTGRHVNPPAPTVR